MNIIDTHSHIYAEEFDTDRSIMIERALEVGVKKILLPNVDTSSIAALHQLTAQYPDLCLPMMGLHPTSVKDNWQQDLAVIQKQLEENNYYAIGEIGIDLYWDQSFKNEQIIVFEEQLKWSIARNLPVAIHTRNASTEVCESITRVGADKLRGVFHSFVGTKDELLQLLEFQNFYIGINGVVTYKNSNLRDILHLTSLHKILIETDAPYLPPVPFRGKRNEPSYTQYIVKELATIYNTDVETICETTSNNACKLFNIACKLFNIACK